MNAKPPKLLDRVRREIRVRQLSRRTERTYAAWIRRFILFHGKRHPRELAEDEVNAFLTHLAADRDVSPSTQTQALSALLFLYRHVLDKELGELDIVRPKRPRRLPVVLAKGEVRAVLAELGNPHRLVATLLYGSGLRLLEALRLRVKDLDFDRGVAVYLARYLKGGPLKNHRLVGFDGESVSFRYGDFREADAAGKPKGR